MKSNLFLIFSLFALAMNYSNAQSPIKTENLPFGDITEYPDTYAPGSVAARMVESLGFRYRYASQDLKTTDFSFKAEEEARTIGETIEHIYGLSMVIRNAVIEEPYEKIASTDPMVIRAETLHVLKATYDHLIGMDEGELSKITIRESYPFWVVINGPLADALWHSGQIATLRRANGNPMPKGVNVFLGKFEEVK
ncbi:hypothetical protein IFO69_08810 [Echinicola sp. CAU 1574]|uniref:DinB family protein n=1 Tax=Echinicola arenosa TaxID=2774144 RepID=A0ABR9AJ97_9BACT|nr:hypothetical protein [Echinicola arenosa]MBD8488842.1 hypothetical protein [Echinicola arenosa]